MPASTASSGEALVRRACLGYCLIFAWSGFNQAYLPAWFASRGLSEPEIALTIGLPFFLRLLVTPFIGRIADGLDDRRPLMAGLALASLMLALLLSQQTGFFAVLALYLLMLAALQNISPIFDAGAVDLVRRGHAGNFGRMRLWGSAGYAVAALIGGYVLRLGGLDLVFAGFVCAVALLLPAAAIAPVLPRRDEAQASLASRSTEAIARPAVLAMMLAASLVLASQATWNAFGSIRLRELGVPDPLIGTFWALATGAEIAMFWAGPLLARRLSSPSVLALGAGAAVIRWGLMASDPGIALTLVLQLMHALTFSCAHLGLQAFMARAVPSSRGASAQANFVTMNSVLLGMAVIATGPIYQRVGSGAYLFAAAVAAAALVVLMLARRPIAAALEDSR